MSQIWTIEVRYDNGYQEQILAFSLTTARAKAWKKLADDFDNVIEQVAIDDPDGYTVELVNKG